jgi:two-component system chemotaxis sensor kinase CheA
MHPSDQAAFHRQAFLDEAHDLIASWEEALLRLEDAPNDAENTNQIFRIVHTLKGAGAMFGFDELAAFLHDIETVLDRVRAGYLHVSRPLVDLLLRSRDCSAALVQGKPLPCPKEEILSHARHFLDLPDQPLPQNTPAPTAAIPPQPATPRLWRIRFRPHKDIYRSGLDPAALVEEVAGLGEAEVILHDQGVPLLGDLDPEACYLAWEVILTTAAEENAIRDVFIFVEGESDVTIEPIPLRDDPGRLGEILVQRQDAPAEVIERALADRKPVGEVLVEAGVVAPAQVQAALAEQRATRQMAAASSGETATIRVPTAKLDLLVDLVGELVTAQARLSQVAATHTLAVLSSVAEEMERLTNALRDTSLGLRMLPIGSTFSRFRRLVRDLAAELGKEVALITSGEDTELDKTMLERLGDPLVHLLRNSVDHGIEPPEARLAQGKPRQGTIHLSAEHAGGEVVIRIADDGRGIDAEAVRAKAIAQGIISADTVLSPEEVLQLIFAPGLSTAAKVSNVSGRGVGMDVVKRNIEALRGHVILASTPKVGTVCTIRLPLTLAIIDGLLVQVEDAFFVLPLAAVEECVELHTAHQSQSAGRLLALRGEMIPYISLRNLFAVPGTPPAIQQVVVVRVQERLLGVAVDTVQGEHQTVIKSLGRIFQHVRGISGATIMGDGTIALIIDLATLGL